MTFARSSQQAKEFLCTLHHCAHFCFPYGKNVRADKVGSFPVRGKKSQQNNKPIHKTKPTPGCERQIVCPPALKSAASLNGGWGGKEEARHPLWVFLSTFWKFECKTGILKFFFIYLFLRNLSAVPGWLPEVSAAPSPRCGAKPGPRAPAQKDIHP